MSDAISITAIELALGLGLLLLGMLVATLLLRGSRADLAPLQRSQAELAGRLSAFAEASARSDARFRQALDERLDAVSLRMGQSLSESQKRTTESLGTLAERLALIDRAQSNIRELAGEVSELSAVLGNKQARGAFGERQMQDILESYLPPRAVSYQSTLSNGTRVDALIHMPGEGGDVAVDSKFPLEAWRRMVEADNTDNETRARAQFARDVSLHVSDIARKYLVPGETHEVALLFLPSEAIYAELHGRFTDVVDKAFNAKVMIVSPTTFMATLHTVKAVMRDAAMREQAGVILREVAKLGEDVARLDRRAAKLQTHFGQAGEDVRQIRISTEKITRRAERMEELEERSDVGKLPDNVTERSGKAGTGDRRSPVAEEPRAPSARPHLDMNPIPLRAAE